MLLIRKDLCDNSKECWFLKNCQYDVARYENGQVIIDGNRCSCCFQCEGHCEITAVVENENEVEKAVMQTNLQQLQARDMSLDVYGAEPINSNCIIYSAKDAGNSYDETISLIENNSNFLLIELLCNDSLICKVAGVYFDDMLKDAGKVIKEKYNGKIEHAIIYAGNQIKIFKRFADYFGINDISKSPMIVFYHKKRVLGVYSHGLIHNSRYSSDEFKQEVKRIMENYDG